MGLDAAAVREILGPGGRVAARLPGYQARAEQMAMAEAGAQAIAEGKHLLVEAGTGVGKSFAYLVPALLAATRCDPPKRVVVSTHTISVQEQLIHKDVPFLRAVWPEEFSAVLVKGRGNYMSRRRALAAQRRAGAVLFDDGAHQQLEHLVEWMDVSTDGSLADLPYRPFPNVWENVRSEHGNCLGKACPEHQKCFYFAARRRIWNANLLIVNHSLLFADLALKARGFGLLPEYHVVVFDEAHTLEDVAANHLGLEATSGSIEHLLGRLYSERTQKGMLIHHKWQAILPLVEECRFAAVDFFDSAAEWRKHNGGSNGRVRQAN
ncbi:MAG: ATP-dependent DNA helicase, partial [Planctomycetia bacterium]